MSVGFTNCQHDNATASASTTTNQVNHYCPSCGVTWTTWPDAKQVTAIKTWQERMKPEYQDSALLSQPFMQAEIDELRAALAAKLVIQRSPTCHRKEK